MSERSARIFFVSLAVSHLGLGVWLFFFPRSFFTTIGAFEAYNRHYERDTATFYFAFSFGAGVAARRPSWRLPVLAMTTLQYVLHTINHGIDAGESNNSWAGLFDVISLAAASIQFAGLLWILRRREAVSR